MDVADDVTIMENGHWIIVYVAVALWRIQMARNTKVYVEMSQMVKSGVYIHGNYTEKDRETFETANAHIVKANWFFSVGYIVAVLATLTKSTLFADNPYQPFFYMWLPIEVNSFLR